MCRGRITFLLCIPAVVVGRYRVTGQPAGQDDPGNCRGSACLTPTPSIRNRGYGSIRGNVNGDNFPESSETSSTTKAEPPEPTGSVTPPYTNRQEPGHVDVIHKDRKLFNQLAPFVLIIAFIGITTALALLLRFCHKKFYLKLAHRTTSSQLDTSQVTFSTVHDNYYQSVSNLNLDALQANQFIVVPSISATVATDVPPAYSTLMISGKPEIEIEMELPPPYNPETMSI